MRWRRWRWWHTVVVVVGVVVVGVAAHCRMEESRMRSTFVGKTNFCTQPNLLKENERERERERELMGVERKSGWFDASQKKSQCTGVYKCYSRSFLLVWNFWLGTQVGMMMANNHKKRGIKWSLSFFDSLLQPQPTNQPSFWCEHQREEKRGEILITQTLLH